MRAILTAVDYTDYLRLTLPRNRHHFSSVLVVTSPADAPNVRPVAEASGADVFVTDAFYRDGAHFAKYAALEEGLDAMGRYGWTAILDADVLWPAATGIERHLRVGHLYTPPRRMMVDMSVPIPPEAEWGRFPLHRNVREWSGYTQIFHAADPHLGPAPWHETGWVHAGGGDSHFQAKWPASLKVRPPFEVLHLGEPGANWCGRSSVRLDGTAPEGGAESLARLREYMAERRAAGPGRYGRERRG